MGRNIRIHKDITLRWRVKTNGASTSLLGRDLVLFLTDPFGDKTVLNFSVTDTNLITAVFYGKDQSKLGSYILTLAENVGQEGSNAVDEVDAFNLVSRSCMETPGTSDNFTAASLELTGDLATNGRGASAYEIWLSLGNTGTEQDFIDSLKGADGEDGKDGTNGTDGKDGAPGKDGANGVGVKSMRQVVVSTKSGGENVIRITLTDGTYADFYVRNGDLANLDYASIIEALGFTPANDMSVVHNTGIEDVDGAKTFLKPIYIKGSESESTAKVLTYTVSGRTATLRYLGYDASLTHPYQWANSAGAASAFTDSENVVSGDPIYNSSGRRIASNGTSTTETVTDYSGDVVFRNIDYTRGKLQIQRERCTVGGVSQPENIVVTGVADPVDDNDVANKAYVDSHSGGGGGGNVTELTTSEIDTYWNEIFN